LSKYPSFGRLSVFCTDVGALLGKGLSWGLAWGWKLDIGFAVLRTGVMVFALLGLGKLGVGVGCLLRGGLGFLSGGGEGALGMDIGL
jgi:hypothetical protein